jgi:hypothetical protein
MSGMSSSGRNVVRDNGTSKTGAANGAIVPARRGGLHSAGGSGHMAAAARRRRRADSEKPHMHVTLGVPHLQPIVSLAAGVLILVRPQLLNFVVAIYLILSGIIGLGLIR